MSRFVCCGRLAQSVFVFEEKENPGDDEDEGRSWQDHVLEEVSGQSHRQAPHAVARPPWTPALWARVGVALLRRISAAERRIAAMSSV